MKIPSQSNFENFSKKDLYEYIQFLEDLINDFANKGYKDYLIGGAIMGSLLLSLYFFYPQLNIAPGSCMKAIEYACHSYGMPKYICEQPLNIGQFPSDY